MAQIDDAPSGLRFPRGEGLGVEMPKHGVPMEIGKGRVVREGSTIAILSYGTRLEEALKAADDLAARGLSVTVADARFCKPLDEDLVRQLGSHHEVLLTVEEGSIGGFASHVTKSLTHRGLLDGGLKFRPIFFGDIFVDQDKPEKQNDLMGVNARQMVEAALSALGRADEAVAPARA